MQLQSLEASIRVGLTSTEPIRQAGLESAFEKHFTMRIIAGDLNSLLADFSLRYLILDAIHDGVWMEAQQRVRRIRPDIHLVVLGPRGDDDAIAQSIRGGARGYLDANSGPMAVRKAVETVTQGYIWAPRRVLSTMVDQLLRRSVAPVLPLSPTFSPREQQVLDLIMSACSNREIAEELGIEERTVKAYVASLMRKTGVDNRVALSVHMMHDSMRAQREAQSKN